LLCARHNLQKGAKFVWSPKLTQNLHT
jgi:hypothetical protein